MANIKDMTKHLSGTGFPSSKQELVKKAKSNNAPQDVIQMVQGLKSDKFENMKQVWKEAGHSSPGKGHKKAA